LRDVEVPTFSDIRLIDGGKVVNPTRRPFFFFDKNLKEYLSVDGTINLKKELKEIRCEDMDWFIYLRLGPSRKLL
jgi:hypothetical protein